MRHKASKIFVRCGDEIVEFMWADVLSDGSVAMGFLSDAIEEVDFAIDPVRGEVRKPTLITEEKLGRPKLTFHASGHYKLACSMGLTADALDRATVEGPPLAQISAPRLMAEILLSQDLPGARSTPAASDIVLTPADGNESPLRCTIACMSKEECERIVSTRTAFVETSAWECTGVLENDSHIWTWTLRSSRNDIYFPAKTYVMLVGNVKWGNPPQGASDP